MGSDTVSSGGNGSSGDGVKHDTGKPRYSLLPWDAVASVVDVLEYGAKRYAHHNWQRVPQASDRYFDAAMRHLIAWRSGETVDPESRLPHLAHATCCLLFLAWFEIKAESEASDDE